MQPIVLNGTVGTYECDQANTASYDGDLALATVSLTATGSMTGERPLGVRNGQLRIGDGTCNAQGLAGFSGVAHVVVRESGGVQAHVADGAATLWKAQLDNTQSWTAKGSAAFVVAPAKALFHDGTYVGGGGGGVVSGGVFSTDATVDLSGGTIFKTHAPSGAAQAGPASVGSGFAVYGDASGRLVKVSYASGNFGTTDTPVILTAGSSTADTNPVLGAGGLVYSLSANGTLVVSRTSDLVEQWRLATYFPISQSKVSQPALDLLRDGVGSKQCRGLGVLYVPTSSTGTAYVTAIIVDSAGLEPMAPWPKYQRDNGNTGNSSRGLTSWTCP
jgi:hypothetical protein